MTSAPNRIFSSRIPNAKAFGNEPLGTAEGSSGSLHEKLQCGQAMGISRISSGETVNRDLHLWHSNVIARISSSPTTILRSNVTLPEVYHAKPSPPTTLLGPPISRLAAGRPQHHAPFSLHSLQAVQRDFCRRSTGVEFAYGVRRLSLSPLGQKRHDVPPAASWFAFFPKWERLRADVPID
jgi:hypothetical protein